MVGDSSSDSEEERKVSRTVSETEKNLMWARNRAWHPAACEKPAVVFLCHSLILNDYSELQSLSQKTAVEREAGRRTHYRVWTRMSSRRLRRGHRKTARMEIASRGNTERSVFLNFDEWRFSMHHLAILCVSVFRGENSFYSWLSAFRQTLSERVEIPEICRRERFFVVAVAKPFTPRYPLI